MWFQGVLFLEFTIEKCGIDELLTMTFVCFIFSVDHAFWGLKRSTQSSTIVSALECLLTLLVVSEVNQIQRHGTASWRRRNIVSIAIAKRRRPLIIVATAVAHVMRLNYNFVVDGLEVDMRRHFRLGFFLAMLRSSLLISNSYTGSKGR